MTNPVNFNQNGMMYPYRNEQPANQSGVTININNPSVNSARENCTCPHCSPNNQPMYYGNTYQPPVYPNYQADIPQMNGSYTAPQNGYMQQETMLPEQQYQKQAVYPAPYYINNYNSPLVSSPQAEPQQKPLSMEDNNEIADTEPKDMFPNRMLARTTEEGKGLGATDAEAASQGIISEMDRRTAEEIEREKNNEKSGITKLTNEYIKSLEDYLDNPDKEIRKMATKEVLARLAEDTDRFDDPALNALLNKMLQDPEKIVRIAAMSALSSGLASGNDYTVKLLKDIQNNPESDKEDLLETSNILLKMTTEKTKSTTLADNNNTTNVEPTKEVENENSN